MKSLVVTENTFSPSETRDIINEVIKAKINFYKIKNLRSNYFFDRDDEEAIGEINRLEALKATVLQAIRQVDKVDDVFVKINVEVSTEGNSRKMFSNRLTTAVA